MLQACRNFSSLTRSCENSRCSRKVTEAAIASWLKNKQRNRYSWAFPVLSNFAITLWELILWSFLFLNLCWYLSHLHKMEVIDRRILYCKREESDYSSPVDASFCSCKEFKNGLVICDCGEDVEGKGKWTLFWYNRLVSSFEILD